MIVTTLITTRHGMWEGRGGHSTMPIAPLTVLKVDGAPVDSRAVPLSVSAHPMDSKSAPLRVLVFQWTPELFR